MVKDTDIPTTRQMHLLPARIIFRRKCSHKGIIIPCRAGWKFVLGKNLRILDAKIATKRIAEYTNISWVNMLLSLVLLVGAAGPGVWPGRAAA